MKQKIQSNNNFFYFNFKFEKTDVKIQTLLNSAHK